MIRPSASLMRVNQQKRPKQQAQRLEGSPNPPANNGSAAERRKPGRPPAKHSDKLNYAQMSLYIRREIRNRTKVRLFEQGLEFSGLVESLLEAWLEKQEQK